MPKKSKYESLFTLRKDGCFQGRYKDRNGVWKTVASKDPEALFYKLKELQEQANEPVYVLFRDIAESWHESVKIKDNTWTAYESHYNKAMERFRDCKAADISTPDITEFYDDLAKQGFALNTIRNVRSVLSGIFSAAMNNREFSDTVQRNPTQGAIMPKSAAKPKHREAPEDEIVEAIRDRAETVDFGIFALALISTGMRRGEALGLTWDCIDFENNAITIRQQVTFHNSKPIISPPKTESGNRAIMLLPDLKAVLEKVSKRERTGYVFWYGDREHPMTQSVYVRRWNNYCRAMGFSEESVVPTVRRGKQTTKTVHKHTLTAHVMRHGYATLLFESGVDPYTAKELLGHSDIETTLAIYTHLRKRQKQRSIGSLADKVSLKPSAE